VILAGASCKSFLESQAAPRQGTAVEKSCRDPLSRSRPLRPFPQATHHPRFNRPSTFAPFARRLYDPAGKTSSAVQPAGTFDGFFLWLETSLSRRQLVGELQERCHKSPPGLRGAVDPSLCSTQGPVQGTYIVFQLWILDSDSPLTAVSTYCLRIELGGEFLTPTSASPLFNKRGRGPRGRASGSGSGSGIPFRNTHQNSHDHVRFRSFW
jgi:hypothetical protein